jgi:type IV pilus assembly protein PilM
MANPRVAWGIDIGNRALKAVKLVRTADGVKIDDVDIIEHENILSNAGDNRDQLIQTALALFTSKHQLKGSAAAVGVSGQQSFARFIKLPPVEDRKIPEIVRFEAIQQIPFPLDEVEWAYQLFRDEGNPDVEVGIFAMRKELVNQHLANFSGAGLNVQAVQMNPLADYNALQYDDKIKGATMIIDLGAENADLIIAEGETVWMRSIPIGGNHFTEALVRDFKLRFERAEELKRTTATSPHGRRILQAMRPVFADLVSEIQRSIGFYSSTHRDSRISRVLALGGTFKLPGLQKYLQQNLSLEVVKLDSLGQTPPTDAKVAAALNENILSCVSAYGLALQALGEAKIKSSLLPQAIQRERFWQAKIKWFAAAAACFVVGTVISFVVAQQQQGEFESADAKGFRRDADSAIAAGKRQDQSWQGVQSAGAEDRKKMAEVKTLAEYRDVWPTLYTAIDNSIPQPEAVKERSTAKEGAGTPAKPAKPAAPAAKPATSTAGKPATTPAVNAVAEKKFGLRPGRREAVLEDIEVQYAPHIGDFVHRNADGTWFRGDDEFNLHKGNRDPATYLGVRGRHAGQNAAVGGGASGPRIDAPVMPVVSSTPNQAPDASTASANVPDKRGYFLTLHLTTPNNGGGQGGGKFIEDTVVAALLQQERVRLEKLFDAAELKAFNDEWSKIPADEILKIREPHLRIQKLLEAYAKLAAKKAPRQITFTIARASIPSAIQIEYDSVRIDALRQRAQQALERKQKALLAQPGIGVNPGDVNGAQPNPALLPPPTGGIGVAADPAGGAGGVGDPNAQNEELDKLLVDPVTKESIKKDYVVTVLVAVVLDPLPNAKQPPPSAEGSEGQPAS